MSLLSVHYPARAAMFAQRLRGQFGNDRTDPLDGDVPLRSSRLNTGPEDAFDGEEGRYRQDGGIGTMSNEHKAALAEGREQRAGGPSAISTRSSRTALALTETHTRQHHQRLAAIDERIGNADPLSKAPAGQESTSGERPPPEVTRATLISSKTDFMAAAAAYGQR
jgi:hypothetical protein